MNSYDIIINKLVEWATRHEDIRALVLIGSRARSSDPADKWSDLDVLVIAQDISVYVQTADWICAFGTPLLTFTETAFDGSVERRVLYEGFMDVDFALSDPDGFRRELALDAVRAIFRRGYRVLLDKDGWQDLIQEQCGAPQDHALSRDEIANEIHDYWYHCIWLTKKVQRGELWTAVRCLNGYMQAKLLRMIEISSRLAGGDGVDTWHNGRFLEKWADPAIIERLQGCFADYDLSALKRALGQHMDLYHDLAWGVAAKLDIPYPHEERQQIIEWIDKTMENT
jgi:aminoglycoside 6-adenylyltransferase